MTLQGEFLHKVCVSLCVNRRLVKAVQILKLKAYMIKNILSRSLTSSQACKQLELEIIQTDAVKPDIYNGGVTMKQTG